jgi:hypothetical protein
MSFRIPPTPTYKRNLAELESYYKKALKELIKLLVNLDPKDLIRTELYSSLIRQITFIINDLDSSSKEWLEKTLTDAFENSVASSLVTMGFAKTLFEAKGTTQFSLISRNRVEAMLSDTFRDILKAHSVMEESLKNKVRELQAEVLKVNIVLQRGTITSAKDIKNKLIEEGFSKSLVEEYWKGITDASGKRWDLTTYSQMVARTKLQQAQAEGAKQTALENDSDLAVVSSHGAKDACRYFEGMIISLTGRTKGYKTYADLRASNLIFHPNCQHSLHPIGDLNVFPKSLKEEASNAEKSAEKALEDPNKIKQEDNKRRYEEQKAKQEELKRKRKQALEKARKAREQARSQ